MSETLQNNHKYFEYISCNEESCLKLLQNHYPWFIHIYENYQYPIQKCDAIRPFILYHYGGIYLDMDSTCIKNIYENFKKPGVYILERLQQLKPPRSLSTKCNVASF